CALGSLFLPWGRPMSAQAQRLGSSAFGVRRLAAAFTASAHQPSFPPATSPPILDGLCVQAAALSPLSCQGQRPSRHKHPPIKGFTPTHCETLIPHCALCFSSGRCFTRQMPLFFFFS